MYLAPIPDMRCCLGPSRCFPFFQELMGCYVVNTSAEDVSGKNKCAPALEDYYECLHHKKEVGDKRQLFCELLANLSSNPGRTDKGFTSSLSQSRNCICQGQCPKCRRYTELGTNQQRWEDSPVGIGVEAHSPVCWRSRCFPTSRRHPTSPVKQSFNFF